MLGGAWCARGIISSSIAALPGTWWWNTADVNARPFWPQDNKARHGTIGRSHKDRARRAFGGSRLHVVQFAGTDINVRCCCVVYQFVEIQCTRFYVCFVALIIFSLSKLTQIYKVVLCTVRTNHTRGIYPRYYPTKNFRKFCRTFIAVPEASGSSVRYSHPYPELLGVLYARATNTRGAGISLFKLM